MHKKAVIAAALIIALVWVSCAYARADGIDPHAGVMLTDDTGQVLYSRNKTKTYVPASVLKIHTALAAIRILGPDYRFSTEYYFDRPAKSLYVRGYGDPLFISEEIDRFCRRVVAETGTNRIHDIFLDHSFFSSDVSIPGIGNSLNPYDAPSGALSANFNTITFKWDAKQRLFSSGEPQTPFLPFFLKSVRQTGLSSGRIVLTEGQSRVYPGLLMQHFLSALGVEVTGKVTAATWGSPPPKAQKVMSSYRMTSIVKKLLEYSNNFIANQLMFTIGSVKYGGPATTQIGVQALNAFASDELQLDGVVIHEGSGLSRYNRISPEQMVKILTHFRPYHMLLKKKKGDYYKTGTLTGVRTRAGFLTGQDNRLYPYTIMVNNGNPDYVGILKKLKLIVRNDTKSID